MFNFIFLAILSLCCIPKFCFVLSKTASVMILDKKLKMAITRKPIGHSQRFSCHLKIISQCTYSRKESHFGVSSLGQICNRNFQAPYNKSAIRNHLRAKMYLKKIFKFMYLVIHILYFMSKFCFVLSKNDHELQNLDFSQKTKNGHNSGTGEHFSKIFFSLFSPCKYLSAKKKLAKISDPHIPPHVGSTVLHLLKNNH